MLVLSSSLLLLFIVIFIVIVFIIIVVNVVIIVISFFLANIWTYQSQTNHISRELNPFLQDIFYFLVEFVSSFPPPKAAAIGFNWFHGRQKTEVSVSFAEHKSASYCTSVFHLNGRDYNKKKLSYKQTIRHKNHSNK